MQHTIMASVGAGASANNNQESALGYIHNVSAVKTSDAKKAKYFNALFQTGRDEIHGIVIFQAELHRQFVQAAENGTPVKITNITKCLSK